jgi:hypothetical protein
VTAPVSPLACPACGVVSEQREEMSAIATIRILCEANPTLGSAVVNGLLAWGAVLGASTAFCSGLPAALFARDTTPAHIRADLINRGLGIGFRIGMLVGPLMCFVFVAKIAS